jgi:hypothetical protein
VGGRGVPALDGGGLTHHYMSLLSPQIFLRTDLNSDEHVEICLSLARHKGLTDWTPVAQGKKINCLINTAVTFPRYQQTCEMFLLSCFLQRTYSTCRIIVCIKGKFHVYAISDIFSQLFCTFTLKCEHTFTLDLYVCLNILSHNLRIFGVFIHLL